MSQHLPFMGRLDVSVDWPEFETLAARAAPKVGCFPKAFACEGDNGKEEEAASESPGSSTCLP